MDRVEYILENLQGLYKWIEIRNNSYIVDPLYEIEFKAYHFLR